MICIVVTTNEKKSETLLVDKLTIGRSDKNDIVVSDKGVSAFHCKVTLRLNGTVFYDDLFSKNGSKINHKKISEEELKVDDVVRIGQYTTIQINQERVTSDEEILIGKRKDLIDEELTLILKDF